RVAKRIEEAPLLLVVGRGRPARGFKKTHQFRTAQRLSAHRSRRPTLPKKRLDRMVWLAEFGDLRRRSHHAGGIGPCHSAGRNTMQPKRLAPPNPQCHACKIEETTNGC